MEKYLRQNRIVMCEPKASHEVQNVNAPLGKHCHLVVARELLYHHRVVTIVTK